MPIHTEGRASKKSETESGARVMGEVGWRWLFCFCFVFLAKTFRIDVSDKVTSEMLESIRHD